jgi:hypothetical protein
MYTQRNNYDAFSRLWPWKSRMEPVMSELSGGQRGQIVWRLSGLVITSSPRILHVVTWLAGDTTCGDPQVPVKECSLEIPNSLSVTSARWNASRSLYKGSVIVVRHEPKLKYVHNFMKIRSAVLELLTACQTDRWTNRNIFATLSCESAYKRNTASEHFTIK